jgi:hypothetical protein
VSGWYLKYGSTKSFEILTQCCGPMYKGEIWLPFIYAYLSWVMALFLLENRDFLGFWMLFKAWLNQFFSNLTQCCGPIYKGEILLRCIYVYRSWVMAVCLLENKDYLGFQMIFKVYLNEIFSNCNTRLWTNKYRLRSITVYFTFTVPELWAFFS